MTAFEDKVNAELPRRPALLKVAAVGYDGDPNDSGAPAIVKNAPSGTYYLQETPEALWRKTTVAEVWTENEDNPQTNFTETAITVTIDPASTVPTPPADTIFTTQAQVDAYLTANSGVAFKYVPDYTDTLPPYVVHAITIDLVAGVHRPKAGQRFLNLALDIHDPGSVRIGGVPVSQYAVVHSGGTIRAHQTLDEVTGIEDPYVDCDAATFPNDESLNGRIAVFSNGFYSQIWEHTDSRLWLCKKLNPVPIDDTTTVEIKEPATIVRNSTDDTTKNPSSGDYIFHLESFQPEFAHQRAWLEDLLIQDFGTYYPLVQRRNARWNLNRLIIDKTYGPLAESGNGITFWGGYGTLADCSVISSYGPTSTLTMLTCFNAEVVTYQCYFQGGDTSMSVSGRTSTARLYHTIFRGADGFYEAVWTWAGAKIIFDVLSSPGGVIPTILDVPNKGAFSVHGGVVIDFWGGSLRLRDIGGPGITLYSGVTLELHQGGTRVVDGGGNTGVGFLMIGPSATLLLGAGVTLAGAAGDVKFDEDDSIWSYAQVAGLGPIVDGAGNVVQKV